MLPANPYRNTFIRPVIFCLVMFLGLFLPGRTRAQSVSNAGTEFWSVFPTHEPDNSALATLSLFITGAEASSGTVSVGAFSSTFTLSANSVLEIPVPRSAAYIAGTDGNRVLAGRAIHILVDPGKPKVVVYSHIFAGRRSAATLILPKDALGQRYFSMNYTQDDAGQNYIAIVATEPHTRVRIKKGATELVPGGVLLDQVNDVYEYLSTSDLTGVSITADSLSSACNSFAVFSGSSGIRIGSPGCDPQSIDPLYQQNYPVASWGKNYGFIPFSMQSPGFASPVRTAGQYARILARENGTTVSINGITVATLNSGEYYTTPQPLTTASYITADQPVSVAQYALTQSCSNTNAAAPGYSDPDMVILNPIEYNINHITVYSSTKENITEQYLNILIKTSAAASLRINGNAPAAPFIPMNTLAGYSYLQLSLNSLGAKTFTLNASEGFNATAYGFGNVESYAYSAGTNLASAQSISAIIANTNQPADSACINNDFFFRLVLPFRSPQISWQMDATEAPVLQNNPVATALPGQLTAYQYTFPKTAAYLNPGKHLVKIIAQYPPASGGCSKTQELIDYAFTVIPVPLTDFSARPESCHNTVDFTDLTAGNIISRSWDFGDGQNSASPNPVHTYADTGRYIVRLTTSFSTGCQNFKLDTLIIKQKIYPGFTFSRPDCAGQAVTFQDTSKTTDFTIASRRWDFGDGDTLRSGNNAAFQHRYQKAGTYTVKLQLTNTEGCAAAPFTQTVVIYDNPVPDFKLPAVCITDQVAQFTDLSTIPAANERPFHYQWNFGDPNATAANPDTSSLQNPVHRYTATLTYPVTLTITSPQGCTATVTKAFTVNGANPVASFKLLNDRACSSNAVMVQNSSTVDFGNISKLEWRFDDLSQPGTTEVYTDSLPGRIFRHPYPVFYTPGSKTYRIRLTAYSGTSCVTDTFKTVTLLAAPQTAFDSLNAVCLSAPPFKISQARETSGISGTGVYSGEGTSADGTFDPRKAGTGIHRILYKFTAMTGCADSVSSAITVLADPVADAGPDQRIYLGDKISLSAGTNSAGLSYRWTPASGLDHDDIPNPVASPDHDITYTLTVSNGACEVIDQVFILVVQPLVIPNTFSPNGDNINDTWNIKNLNYYYPGAKVYIYARNGRQLFSSTGYPVPWDGSYKGRPLPVGTYYYVIDIDGGPNPLSGWLQLIR